MTLPRPKQLIGLVAWVVICFVAAGLGSAASVRAGPFYMELVRPDWAPPPSIFGPVWTTLYATISVAAWLVWRLDGFRSARTALILFLVQLLLNALWSWLFFAWHLGALAFADILLLWVLIVATLISFWRIQPLAGALLIPYLLWVSFASVLNYSVWQLNAEILGSRVTLDGAKAHDDGAGATNNHAQPTARRTQTLHQVSARSQAARVGRRTIAWG